jgi:hypothetical protein
MSNTTTNKYQYTTNGREQAVMVPANTVATDSEWDPKAGWLMTQVHAPASGVTVAYTRDDLPDGVPQALEEEAARLGVLLRFVRRDDATNLLQPALPELFPAGAPARVDLMLYFSPKDAEFLLGWDTVESALRCGTLSQRNALAGRVGRGPLARLCDLFGWTKQSLAKLTTALGLSAEDKTLMDQYKTCMYRGLIERPRDFLRYAVADAALLPQLYAAFVGKINAVMSDVLGVPQRFLLRPGRVPMTTGRLLYEVFANWLVGRCADGSAFLLAMSKVGFLDPTDEGYLPAREAYGHLLAAVHDRAGVRAQERDTVGRAMLQQLRRASYQVHAFSAAGVSWWASRARTESSIFNAVLQGGRCNNEMPYECRTGPGLDVDLSACYGSALREMVYPVGVPSVLSYKPNERRPSLGEFLKRYEGDLVPRLWQVIVSGKLRFDQDLVPSTVITAGALGGASERGDLAGHFALLRREIVNGVITHDVLGAIRRVATNAEWRAFMGLEVVTAAFYKASDLRGEDAWVDEVLAAPYHGARACLNTGERADTRPTLWHGVPLEEFVGKLVDERRLLKQRARAGDAEAGALDNVVKLLTNTLYGDIASSYFEIGNTVVANNITARARVGVWMLAKSLGLRQTITDGGIYCPSAVPVWRGKRPGLETFSRMWGWRDRQRRRTFVPLGDRDWPAGVCPDDADEVATAHVSEFWAPYGLTLPFRLEHKPEHTFLAAGYWGKGDYALLLPGGRRVYRCRGKSAPREGETVHPRVRLFDAILDGSDDYPAELSYRKGGILKVASYLKAQQSGGFEWLKGLRPGDTVPPREHHAQENNLHMPLADAAVWKKRASRRQFRRGRRQEWFEVWRSRGIRAVLNAMKADRLPHRRTK